MASITLAVDADVATWSSGIAAGAGDHLPIGNWGSADYRSAIRFAAPAWSGWTSITKATLTFYISDHNHVGVRNSSIYCKRQSIGSLWTKGEGSQDCESGFSASNTSQYDDIVPSSTDQVTFSSGTTANAKKSLTVTDLVQYYWDNSASKIVFVFDNVGSGDYTELWSKGKAGGYNAELVIEYEVQSPPNAPTLGVPSDNSTQTSQTPTYTWTHSDPQGDAQAGAEIRRFNSTGGTLQATHVVTGSAQSLVSPDTLTRGTTYQYDVRTKDASGTFGPYSAKRTFTVLANPVVTISPTRQMVYASGAPRLKVSWSCDQTQKKYRVQAGAYDSGWVTSTAQAVTLSSLALTNGTAVNVTVSVEAADATLQGSATRSFTPRWGQTVHRRDLTAAPSSWGTPSLISTVPTNASLIIEYGSSATAVAAPTTWYSTLSSVPKQRYVFYRATLIPNSTTSPSLDKIVIPANFAVDLIDHWYGSLAGGIPNGNIAPPWSIDAGEYVYGTRSISRDGNGAIGVAYSERIKVRGGRSYILTGLMKSEGNSQASFGLFDADAQTYVTAPDGSAITSETLAETRDWFQPDRLDTYRYRTPVWVAPNDMDVTVRLRQAGAAGTSAWWDGLKLEESTVATPWGPSAVGAVALDAGGIQIDATKGGVFRGRASSGGVRDLIGLGTRGLMIGPQTQLWDNGTGELYLQNLGGGSMLRLLGNAGEAATQYQALLIQRGADVNARMVAGYSGDVQRTGIFMGDGTAARDTNLYRSAADELTTDDALKVGGLISALGGTSGMKGYAILQFLGDGTVVGTGDKDLAYTGGAGAAVQMRMPFAGSVVAISIASSVGRTAGTLMARAYNGSAGAIIANSPFPTLDATNTSQVQTTAVEGACVFAANTLLRLRITGNAFTPTATTITAFMVVKFE